MKFYHVHVVPTAKKLKRVPEAKPRVYPITASNEEKLISSLQTIMALDYYIAGISEVK